MPGVGGGDGPEVVKDVVMVMVVVVLGRTRKGDGGDVRTHKKRGWW